MRRGWSKPSQRPIVLVVLVSVLVIVLALANVKANEENCILSPDGTCLETCNDSHERCPIWALEGECKSNLQYMTEHCPKSCGVCVDNDVVAAATATADAETMAEKSECIDHHERCTAWASIGECDNNPDSMKRHCPRSCGVCSVHTEAQGEVQPGDTGGGDGSASTTATTTTSDDDGNDSDCVDQDDNCAFWAMHGECDANPRYMRSFCTKSCKACGMTGPPRRRDEEYRTPLDEKAKWEEASRAYGEKQVIEGSDAADTLDLVRRTIEYMENDVPRKNLPRTVLDACRNRHELCAFWAVIGECEKNKAYMVVNCAPSCMSCDLIDFDARCPPLDKTKVKPGLEPGDLNKMFQRIVETAPGNRTLTEEERKELEDMHMPLYTVTVHSRPSEHPSTVISRELDKKLPPWVITLDNFITEEECRRLIDLGHEAGYERSKDVGGRLVDGTHDAFESTRRTSENAWCSSKTGCREDEIATRVRERIAAITGIPADNSEDLQLLKYEVGQFYRTHHDYIPHQRDRQCGPRILTFFLYLSDVEEGGGTDFPDLGIMVLPKRGRALLWPSVIDSSPFDKDGRMMHQALPVEKGTKFAANAWIHQYDYVTPQGTGCN